MDYKREQELKKIARNIPVRNILNHYNVKGNGTHYSCPFHADNKPSASIYENINKLNCFSCEKCYDPIDLVMQLDNCNYYTALEIIADKSYIDRTPIKRESFNNQKAKTYEEKIKWFKPNRATTNEYLEGRGLDSTVAKKHLYNNGYRMGVDKLLQIIYDFNTFAIVKGPKGKFNWGTPGPIYLKNNMKESNLWFICEGIEDALSALAMGYNAITLNSVSNIGKFLKGVNTDYEYVLALDNDNGGLKGEEKLKEHFNKNNIKYKLYRGLKKSNCKDLNEYYNKCLSCYNNK